MSDAPVEWIVQSADPTDVVMRRVLLVRDAGAQPEILSLNVMPETYPQAFRDGDVFAVTFVRISSRGSNGQPQ